MVGAFAPEYWFWHLVLAQGNCFSPLCYWLGSLQYFSQPISLITYGTKRRSKLGIANDSCLAQKQMTLLNGCIAVTIDLSKSHKHKFWSLWLLSIAH